MGRFLPRLWTGSSLFIALLACGCQHNRCCCSKCLTPAAATTAISHSGQTVSSVHTVAKLDPAKAVQIQDLPPSLREAYPSAPAAGSEHFGHDPNYRWLMGILDYSRIQEAWLLRYVPFEEDDRYGGCVTLVGFASLPSLKPGQYVRVEGALIDPESRQLRPAFQVRNLRVLGP